MKTDPFDSRPGEYDAWYDENQELFREEIGLVMDWVKGSPSLEIGAGTGRFASSLGIGFGLDRARGALELARGRGIRVVLGDAGGLPFKKECFALVGIFFSLEFFADPASALAESARVLRPGGHLVILHILPDSNKGQGIIKKKGRGFYAGMVRLYSARDVREMAVWLRLSEERARDGLSALLFVKT